VSNEIGCIEYGWLSDYVKRTNAVELCIVPLDKGGSRSPASSLQKRLRNGRNGPRRIFGSPRTIFHKFMGTREDMLEKTSILGSAHASGRIEPESGPHWAVQP